MKSFVPEFKYIGDISGINTLPENMQDDAIREHAERLGHASGALFESSISESTIFDMYNSEGNSCGDAIRRICDGLARRNLADASHEEIQIMKAALLRMIQHDIMKLDNSFRGIVSPSGTAANQLALQLARDTTKKRKVVCSNLAHVSVQRAAKTLELEAVTFQRDACDVAKIDEAALKEVLEAHDGDIAAVVLTAGDTNFGTFEVPSSELLEEIQKQGIWTHVDAAYGLSYAMQSDPPEGLAALCNSAYVQSVTVDPHKFIGTTPCGALFIRNGEEQLERMEQELDYFSGTPENYFTTSFECRGAATAFYSCRVKGRNGLEKDAQELVERAIFFESLLRKASIHTITPVTGRNVAIALSSRDEKEAVLQHAQNAGFALATIDVPFECGQHIHGVRVLMSNTHEFSEESLTKLVNALQSARN